MLKSRIVAIVLRIFYRATFSCGEINEKTAKAS